MADGAVDEVGLDTGRHHRTPPLEERRHGEPGRLVRLGRTEHDHRLGGLGGHQTPPGPAEHQTSRGRHAGPVETHGQRSEVARVAHRAGDLRRPPDQAPPVRAAATPRRPAGPVPTTRVARGGTRGPGGRRGRRMPDRDSPVARLRTETSAPSTTAPRNATTPMPAPTPEVRLTSTSRRRHRVADGQDPRWHVRSWPDRCRSATAPPRPAGARPGTTAGPPSTGPPPGAAG